MVFGQDATRRCIRSHDHGILDITEGEISLIQRPVSIEFINFGNDPAATSRLERLDHGLESQGIP